MPQYSYSSFLCSNLYTHDWYRRGSKEFGVKGSWARLVVSFARCLMEVRSFRTTISNSIMSRAAPFALGCCLLNFLSHCLLC